MLEEEEEISKEKKKVEKVSKEGEEQIGELSEDNQINLIFEEGIKET